MKQSISLELYTMLQMTRRSLLIFLKDKATVFFSLLAPLIVLLLYILFLGDVQMTAVTSSIPEGVVVDNGAIKAFIDSWMLSGVLGISCVTVSFSANNVMVQDKERGVINDSLTAPVRRWVITFSYFFYNFIVTLFITFAVFVVCLIYLAAAGSWYLSAADVFACLGLLVISAVSATLLTVFVASFFKTESQLGAVIGILSALLGFLIGAYMPMSMMPKVAQYISCLLPASHSTALFRQYLMNGALDNLAQLVPAELVAELKKSFVMEISFFGKDIGKAPMWLYLFASIAAFFALNLGISLGKIKGKSK